MADNTPDPDCLGQISLNELGSKLMEMARASEAEDYMAQRMISSGVPEDSVRSLIKLGARNSIILAIRGELTRIIQTSGAHLRVIDKKGVEVGPAWTRSWMAGWTVDSMIDPKGVEYFSVHTGFDVIHGDDFYFDVFRAPDGSIRYEAPPNPEILKVAFRAKEAFVKDAVAFNLVLFLLANSESYYMGDAVAAILEQMPGVEPKQVRKSLPEAREFVGFPRTKKAGVLPRKK
jgi:hypothetical protein